MRQREMNRQEDYLYVKAYYNKIIHALERDLMKLHKGTVVQQVPMDTLVGQTIYEYAYDGFLNGLDIYTTDNRHFFISFNPYWGADVYLADQEEADLDEIIGLVVGNPIKKIKKHYNSRQKNLHTMSVYKLYTDKDMIEIRWTGFGYLPELPMLETIQVPSWK